MESERLLEDTLVNNPDMLTPGLTLVGRQTRTEGGPLDPHRGRAAGPAGRGR